jgi:hypothetical protein
VSRDPAGERYRVQAQVATAGADNRFVPLGYDHGTGQYVLRVPEQIEARPQQLSLEILAEKRRSPGAAEMDPWFIRRSPPIAIKIAQPFIEWQRVPGLLTSVPLPGVSGLLEPTSEGLPWLPHAVRPPPTFGADLSAPGPAAQAPKFEVPPTVDVEVEIAEKSGWRPLGKRTTSSSGHFHLPVPARDIGQYRYRYHLTGTTPDGAFTLASPWYGFTIRRGWEILALAVVLILAFIQWLSSWRARLSGRLTGDGWSAVSISGRVFDPSKQKDLAAFLEQHGVRFSLVASRWFFLRKRIVLRVEAGQIAVRDRGRHEDVVAASGSKPGRKRMVAGRHTLRIGTSEIGLNASL